MLKFGVNDSGSWRLDARLYARYLGLAWSQRTKRSEMNISTYGYLGPLYDRCISLYFSTFDHDYVDRSAWVTSQPPSINHNRSSRAMADRMRGIMQGTALPPI
jgi:hypothetical protein